MISEASTKMTKIGVSIIIVNYNTTLLTHQCIKSVIEHTKDVSYELILVDNASPDRSIEALQYEFPEIKYIESPENVGFGRANNLGAKYAIGKYLFLLNSDTYLISDSISSFFAFMELPSNSNIWCVGGGLLDGAMKPNVSYGNFPSLKEVLFSFFPKFLRGKYFIENISSGVILTQSTPKIVDYLCGADMFIRRESLVKESLFDPDFFMYFEETELSLRMARLGKNSFILPNVKIVHLTGKSQASTESKLNLKKEIIYESSRILYFRKSFSVLHVVALKIMLVGKNVLKGTVAFDPNYFKLAKFLIFT